VEPSDVDDRRFRIIWAMTLTVLGALLGGIGLWVLLGFAYTLLWLAGIALVCAVVIL
jgi:hypothetical protein